MSQGWRIAIVQFIDWDISFMQNNNGTSVTRKTKKVNGNGHSECERQRSGMIDRSIYRLLRSEVSDRP